MDEGKRKELRDLLGTIDTHEELERIDQRDRAIEKNRLRYRFDELKKSVILPTFREFIRDLEKKGHLTRLREPTTERVRLDVQIQTGKGRRGMIELGIAGIAPGKLKVDYSWGDRGEHEIYSLDQIEAAFVADRVLHLLKGLL